LEVPILAFLIGAKQVDQLKSFFSGADTNRQVRETRLPPKQGLSLRELDAGTLGDNQFIAQMTQIVKFGKYISRQTESGRNHYLEK